MAEGEDQDKDSKTEDPSQKKLDDAISKGQVVSSKEVTSFFVFLMLTLLAIWILPYTMDKIANNLRFFIANAGTTPFDYGMMGIILYGTMKKTLLFLSPIFAAIIIAIIFSSYMQHGQFVFTAEPLQPQLSRISVIKGFSRIFSVKGLVEFLKGIFKITLVGTFVYLVIVSDVQELTVYQELSIAGILGQLQHMIYDILMLVTIIMAAIAGVDFTYQKYDHFTNLKMTKQEVKDEHKQSEGNPEVKRKMRQLRHQQSQKQIKQSVPKATVVITNPEHYAVALQYEMNKMDAPICVAKGLDLIAQKIKEIAKENDVPIVENPPLARLLYKELKIDQEIPVEHFEAVAKIISYVLSLEEKRKQRKLNG